MKKFARFLLITILVTAIAGGAGYFVLRSQLPDTYSSTARLYVVTGPTSSSSLHDSDGGLNKDFEEIILSKLVLEAAARNIGTSEDFSEYIEVNTVAGSNFIDIICYNPDQLTAKRYVDSVAYSALVRLPEVMPVDSVTIYQEGTSTGKSEKRNLIRYTLYIAAGAAGVCVVIGFFTMLFGLAFKKKDEDDEAEYYRNYGGNNTPVAPRKKSSDNREDDEIEIKESPKKRRSEKIEERPLEKGNKSEAGSAQEKAEDGSKAEKEAQTHHETKEEAAARYRAEFEARARQQAIEKAKAQQQAANDMLKIQLEAMESAKNSGVKPVEETDAKEAEEARKRAEEEAAATKRAEEEEAARKKAEAEAAAKKAEQERLEEEARRAENLRLAEEARKAEAARLAAEAAAKKKAEEEAAAKKKAEEEAAAKKKAEEEAAAKKKAEEEAAAKKKAEEEAAAARKAKAYRILERIPK